MERGSVDCRSVAEGMDLGYDHQGGGVGMGRALRSPNAVFPVL